ncbi:MAG: class I SAM-dependent methyltransferase [Candidatus Aminicenantes bacterium]|nr:class I SAM-dependent methyltransferase [Candidatus Aminicenantes bacterium]
MHLRIKVAKLLIKIGRLIQSSTVAVMRPDDLVKFSQQHYANPNNIQGWCDDQVVNSGLSILEQSLLEKININKGRLLLLGLGGGREAIPLAKIGFEVTGVDFIQQMVERAKENAQKSGVKITGLVQEISKLDLPENAFDIIWLSAAMYSCVPTRKRRLAMLRRIIKSLNPGGYFVFGFLWNPKADISAKSVFLKKMIAWLSLGNLHYEKGDMLRFNLEFIHAFTSTEELKVEIMQGGFKLVDIQIIDKNEFAGAIARKPM